MTWTRHKFESPALNSNLGLTLIFLCNVGWEMSLKVISSFDQIESLKAAWKSNVLLKWYLSMVIFIERFRSILYVTLWIKNSLNTEADLNTPQEVCLQLNLYAARNDRTNISSVVEFQRWWVLKSKLFGLESTCH